MAKTRKMTEAELASSIDRLINDSKDYNVTQRGKHRDLALKYADGEIDINPMGKGRSSVVSRDVSDTLGLIKPSIMRVFFSSSRIVTYEPTRQEHEEYAELASDAVNYIVMRECDGYRHFNAAIDDGLLLGNGIVKCWWDGTPEYTTDTFSGLSDAQYKLISNEPDFEEEVEHDEYADPDYQAPEITPEMLASVGLDPNDPNVMEAAAALIPPAPTLHNVTIKRLKSKGRLRIAALPPEEFVIDRSATVLDETTRFCAHLQRKTRSQLVREGISRAKVDKIPRAENDWSGNRQARNVNEIDLDDAPDASTEYVDVYECYVLLDFDGDGIAERRRVVMAGSLGKNAILENEEWGDELPFGDLVPDPKAHNWRGRGLFDVLQDVQRIKTVAMRGVLDNMYQILNPQKSVVNGAVLNMDELINPTFGGVLFLETGAQAPVTVETPSIAPSIFPVVEYMDAVGEKRTGASQRTQALDLDALQNQSATAVNAMQAATFSRVEEYARNISHGMGRIFAICLKLITKHQDRAKMVRLRGKLIEVDPRAWNSDMDVSINTGLGTGSRERDTAMLSGVAQKQEMVVAQFGPIDGPITIKDLFKTYRKMSESSGIVDADSYFPDITDEMLAQMRQKAMQGAQQPNPEAMKAQAQMQLEQAKLQFKMQADAARLQADIEERRVQAQMDSEFRAAEAAAKLQFAREEAAARLQLLREETEARIQIEREKAASQHQTRMAEMNLEAQLSEVKMMLGRMNPDPTNIPRPD